MIYINSKKMRVLRCKYDLTQDDLAKKVGCTRHTIGLIENSKYNPTLDLCTKICKVLCCTLNDLFWI